MTTKKINDLPCSSISGELQPLIDAIPVGLMIVDTGRTVHGVNVTGLRMLGYDTPEEVVGTRCQQHFSHPDSEDCPVGISTCEAVHAECRLHRRDGSEIPISKSAVVVEFRGISVIMETYVDITGQRRQFLDLEESKRQYSTLVDNLPGLVFRCRNDRDWTMEFMSDGCKELTGYLPDELIRNRLRTYNDLIVEEDRERVWKEVQEGLDPSLPFTIEYRIRCTDGRIKWVWERGKHISGDNGEPSFIEGFITDITEQRQGAVIQNSLYEIAKASYSAETTAELFQAIHKALDRVLDASNFFVALYNQQTNSISLPFQVDAKDSFTEFPAGKTLTGYVIETRQPLLATRNVIDELAAGGHIEIVGTMAKVWMGVPLIVRGTVTGVIAVQSYTNAEQYAPQDLALLQFVSDQVATTIARRTTEELLRKEKSYLDQLFLGSRDAIALNDINGMVIRVNPAFVKLFSLDQQEVVGKRLDELIGVPGTRQDAGAEQDPGHISPVSEIETTRRSKDGKTIEVAIVSTPIDLDGVLVGEYSIFRDISDRKRIEKNLIASKEKAEESDRLKSAFLSNMSHEIRTPMNAILGFSSLLSDPQLSDEERKEFVRIINDRGNDLMRIIDDIIDVAKIESGQIRVDIRECRVNVLMANLTVTLNEVKRKSGKSRVLLNCIPGNIDPEFTIMTDANRLRQILTNLIENGLKFTDHGSVDFGYTLKDIDSAAHIEFFVRDTGIGIPAPMHDAVFERFRQADDTTTRRYGGTGLGLTISKNLVQLLGGKITMDSERGKGTTFNIDFPLQQHGVAPAEAPHQKQSQAASYQWKNKVILVVEDEDSNFLLMERMLQQTSAQLTWAKNGIDAIDLCNNRHFDLVLMDIRMPMMDGYETTQIIKKDHKTLPIVAQTAYALKGEREKSLAAGCDDYISKPIDTAELLALLDRYLNPSQYLSKK